MITRATSSYVRVLFTFTIRGTAYVWCNESYTCYAAYTRTQTGRRGLTRRQWLCAGFGLVGAPDVGEPTFCTTRDRATIGACREPSTETQYLRCRRRVIRLKPSHPCGYIPLLVCSRSLIGGRVSTCATRGGPAQVPHTHSFCRSPRCPVPRIRRPSAAVVGRQAGLCLRTSQ